MKWWSPPPVSEIRVFPFERNPDDFAVFRPE